MNCWVHLFSVCLFDPSNVALEANVSAQLAGDFAYHSGSREYGGATVARIGIYDAVPISKHWTITYGVEHESLLNTRSDRGQERVSIGFTWQPFR